MIYFDEEKIAQIFYEYIEENYGFSLDYTEMKWAFCCDIRTFRMNTNSNSLALVAIYNILIKVLQKNLFHLFILFYNNNKNHPVFLLILWKHSKGKNQCKLYYI